MKITTTKKPWGSFVSYTENEKSTVKLLYINKGEAFSLQHHNHREEFWKIIEGNPEITIGDKKIDAHKDDEFIIPVKTNHRIYAPDDNVTVLEISLGQFDEEDIVRIEDKYGRVK